VKRLAAGRLCESFGLSVRRATGLVCLRRASYYYKPKTARDDSNVVHRMRQLVETNRSIGLPMLHVILRREGLVRNHKRTERIYQEQGLAIKLRRRKKRASATRLKLPEASRPNERWSMDFMQAVLWNGRRFRMLCVVDQFTKECPVIEVDTSITGLRVSRVLEWLQVTRGLPEAITVDNGPEFAGMTLDRWAYTKHVKLDFIRPGKPVENAFIESFNGRLRQECLNQHHFLDLEEARRVIEEWRLRYNSFRPHRALRGMTPERFASQWQDKNNNQHPGITPLETVRLEG
jgi:putative transposase